MGAKLRGRAALAVGLAVSTVLTYACVGDDPAPVTVVAADAGGGGQDGTTPDRPDATSPTDAGADAPADPDAALPDPTHISVTNLKLWLTASDGVTCDTTQTPHRVTQWTDKSGAAHHAVPAVSAVGPRCGTTTISGFDVPTFTRPDAGAGPYDDETLSVDLGYLANSNYTILVVEKPASVDGPRAGILGTQIPGESTSATYARQALHFGYESGPQLTLDQNYNYQGGVAVTLPLTSHVLEVVWFDQTVGHRVYRNGQVLFENTAAAGVATLTNATNGAIGRSLYRTASDSRYHGAILEVIAYNAALGAVDLAAVVGYAKQKWGLVF